MTGRNLTATACDAPARSPVSCPPGQSVPAPMSSDHSSDDRSTFDVLFVCTANRVRSPFSAALLRNLPAGRPGGPWCVGSAGLQADEGKPAHPMALQRSYHEGIDLSEHSSRRVTGDM